MLKEKTFIIEHLENSLGEWSLIEYKRISKIIGKKNLWFTNIKLPNDAEKLSYLGSVFSESARKLNLKNSCVLDPESRKTLNPKIVKHYSFFIFGGILGDYPPKKRTRKELSSFLRNIPSYNIGKFQMSTDNAVFVVKKIINGTPIEKIKFKNNISIKINEIESTLLPYRYAMVKGRPLISKELVKYLKKN